MVLRPQYLILGSLLFIGYLNTVFSEQIKLKKEYTFSTNSNMTIPLKINYRKADIVLDAVKNIDSVYITTEPILNLTEFNETGENVLGIAKNFEGRDVTIIELFKCVDQIYFTAFAKDSLIGQFNITADTNGEGIF